MPLDISEARRVGAGEHVTQRQQYKSRVGIIEAAGNPFPLNVDPANLGQLGPGIPLYFALARNLHCLMALCTLAFGLVALKYWSIPEVDLTNGKQHKWIEKEKAVERGIQLIEWVDGWYAGGCGSGYVKLFPNLVGKKDAKEVFVKKKSLRKFTAASRGPWRGSRQAVNESAVPEWKCPDLRIKYRMPTGSRDWTRKYIKGEYQQCGRFQGMPWFWNDKESFVAEDEKEKEEKKRDEEREDYESFKGYVMVAPSKWEIYRWDGARPNCTDKASNEANFLDTLVSDGKKVAESTREHRGQLPQMRNMGERVTWNGLEVYPAKLEATVPPLRCVDVVMPCEGCRSSMIWKAYKGLSDDAEKRLGIAGDIDVLLVSFACLLLMCMAPPLIVRREAMRSKAMMRSRTVRASNYTVYVDGVSGSLEESEESELVKYLQNVLDVRYPLQRHAFPERGAHHIVKVTFVFRLGRLVDLLSRQKDAGETLRRTEEVIVQLVEDIPQFREKARDKSLSCWQQLRWELKLASARYSLRKARRRESDCEHLRAWCLESVREEKKTLQVAGAFVTFEHEVAATRCVEAFAKGLGRRRRLAVPFPFQGRRLRVWPAPEPSDVIWKNYGEDWKKVMVQRLVAFCLLLAVMAAMCYFMGQMTYLKLQLKRDKSCDWAVGPVIVLTDIALRELVAKGVALEMPRSVAMATTSAMWKYLISSIFNGALACLLVHAVLDEESRTREVNWYLEGSLLDNAEAICVSSMLATPVLLLLAPWGNNPLKTNLKLFFLDVQRSEMTQRELNTLASGAEYRLAYRYAAMIKTVFISFLYAPLSPSVFAMGFVSLLLQYWADKICLLRIAQRPPWQDLSLGRHASFALPIVLFPIPVLTVFLLRGVKLHEPKDLWDWLHPCMPWWAQDGYSRAMQFYFLSPLLATLVPLGIHGGIKSLRRFGRAVCSLLQCLAAVVTLVFRVLAFILTLGGCREELQSDERLSAFLKEESPPAPRLGYYQAQCLLQEKYHTCNPVYTVLPEELNPELLEENDSGARSHVSLRGALDAMVEQCLKGLEVVELRHSESSLPWSWRGPPAERRHSEELSFVEMVPVRAG